MTLPIEIAQLPTIDTVQSTTRLLVQDGVTGTPYRQTTVGKAFLDLVDEIGTGTIVAGDVVISGGTADLDLLIAAEGTITNATIIGGTGTFATGSISTLTVAGTLTAGTIAATTINAGTVDISSGKATLATAVVTTGTVGTLTSTTGTIATLNAGTITIGTGTGTLTALNVTGKATLTEANIAGTDHQPLSLSPGWSIQWQDSTGYTAAGITEDGELKAATANIGDATFVGQSLSPGWSLQWSDAAGYAAGGIADDGSLVFDTATIAEVKYKPRSLNPGWSRIWMDANGYIAAGITDAGILTVGQSDTIRTVIGGDGTMTAVADLLPGVVTEVTDSAGYVAQTTGDDGRTRFVPRTNVIAKAARNIVRPTNLHSYTAPKTSTDDTVATDSTIATLWSLDLDFDYIRIVLGQQSANSMTAKACIAATAAANDGVNPVDESAAPGTWVDVTFNNGGSPDFQPWNQNSGATGTIVQNTSAETQVWGLTYSDWMQVSSLPRTDGSPYPLLMIRVHLTGTPAATNMSGANIFGLTPTTSNFGKTWAAYVVSGDFVGTKSGYTDSGTSFGNRWAPLFVQTYSRKLGYQIWGCGDSNMAGTGSANGAMGFYRRAALRVGNRFPVITSNFNQPGSSPAIYMSNVENIIDAVKPSAVVIFPFSYNTAATMANLNTNWARALDMANRISAYGGEPIFVGYPPRDGSTSGEDGVRREGLERLAYAAASGFRTVDPNVYVSTEDVPAQWVTGMSDDGTHFSNKGHAVTADLLSVQLAESFGE